MLALGPEVLSSEAAPVENRESTPRGGTRSSSRPVERFACTSHMHPSCFSFLRPLAEGQGMPVFSPPLHPQEAARSGEQLDRTDRLARGSLRVVELPLRSAFF